MAIVSFRERLLCQTIHTSTGLIGEIFEANDETVTVDIDPDRSGQVLTFDVEVFEID